MATININVPNAKLPAISSDVYKQKIKDFPSKLGTLIKDGEPLSTYINKVSVLTNVPTNLIKLFIFLTSYGDKNYVGKQIYSSNYTTPKGIMGISDATALNTLFKESNLKRLSLDEFSELSKNGLDEKFFNEKIQNTPFSRMVNLKDLANRQVNDKQFFNNANAITLTDMRLLNEKVNVLLGTILIGQLLDKYQNKLEQIIPIYLNLDQDKNVDLNWAINYKGTNVIDLYNKLTSNGKDKVNLAMSTGGFLNTYA
jgi:hypothetical protein